MGYPTYTKAMICYIEAHIEDKRIDYTDLEKKIGFSGAHIRDLFRQNTGYPLVQYIRMRKVKRSAMELIHTDKTILDIAYQYGFANPETYTRAFVKVLGITPSTFRKKKPIVGKQELVSGVYSIDILAQKEQRSDIIMEKNIYKNSESTILYGVPMVAYGCGISQDECGYFISNTWWENADTQAVMCMGPIQGERMSVEQILKNAVKALTGREDANYSKGINAYSAWKKSLLVEKNFRVEDNYSLLFEKLLCHTDAMNCLTDGRKNAAIFMRELAQTDAERKVLYEKAASSFERVVKAVNQIQRLCGDWVDTDGMLKNLAKEEVRKQSAILIDEAEKADREALDALNLLIK